MAYSGCFDLDKTFASTVIFQLSFHITHFECQPWILRISVIMKRILLLLKWSGKGLLRMRIPTVMSATLAATSIRRRYAKMPDYVRGKWDNKGNLPCMTPLRFGLGINRNTGLWTSNLRTTHVMRQDAVAELEAATSDYTLLNAEISDQIQRIKPNTVRIFLQGIYPVKWRNTGACFI